MKPDSITPKIIFTLIGTTILCLGSYFTYNYLSLENDFFAQLQDQRLRAGRRARINLAIPLYSFDESQTLQVIEGLMVNPNIEAVNVRDNFTPSITSLSFKRNEDGTISAANAPPAPGPLLDQHQIVYNGTPIGTVEILFTDRHIQKLLREAFLSKLTALITLTVILSLTLFIILRRTVIKPLGKLETLALSIDQDGRSDAPFDDTACAKEIRNVHGAMVDTLSQLRTRIQELRESQQALRHSEKLLQQAQKMEAIGRLAGGIAHDFNNVLSGIIGYTEIMLLNETGESTRKSQLQQVLSGGKRARDLVKQILTFSSNSQSAKQPLDLRQLVEETLTLLRVSVPVVIELKQELADNCGMVLADPTQFHQVLMNIFTNASHAMEKTGGVLTISMRPLDKLPEELHDSQLDLHKNYVEIAISDTGPGIPEEILDRIFDPFFTTKEKGKGTGMGLSVVYGIIKDMQGRIVVNSQIGAGTTFSIYLPTIEQGETAPEPKMQEAQPASGGTIMVVDDEEMVLGVMQAMLEQMGYSVRVFARSFDALEEFRTHPEDYDMIITDYAMPGINGMELAERCIAIAPEIPILLCTGFSDKINDTLARSRGVKAFVYKPIDRTLLAELVDRVLHHQTHQQSTNSH